MFVMTKKGSNRHLQFLDNGALGTLGFDIMQHVLSVIYSIVEDGAWLAYNNHQSLLQSYAEVHKRMPSTDVPNTTSLRPSSDTVRPTTIFTFIANIQAHKAKIFAFGGLALLVASCQS